MSKIQRSIQVVAIALSFALAVSCGHEGTMERFEARFDQGATVPSDKSITITAVAKHRPECRLSGRAKYNSATERIEIEFHTISCGGDQQPFAAVALDQGESLVGVRAECAAGKQSESAKKPYICLSGKVNRGQSFTVVEKL